MNFQTSHFVANGLYCNFIYLVESYNYFAPILIGLVVSYCIIVFFCRGNESNRLLVGNASFARYLTGCKILAR